MSGGMGRRRETIMRIMSVVADVDVLLGMYLV